MKVLKATIEQKNNIEIQTSHPNLIQFILDANSNWIINKEVLTDSAYYNISELNQLQEIDYKPIVVSLEE